MAVDTQSTPSGSSSSSVMLWQRPPTYCYIPRPQATPTRADPKQGQAEKKKDDQLATNMRPRPVVQKTFDPPHIPDDSRRGLFTPSFVFSRVPGWGNLAKGMQPLFWTKMDAKWTQIHHAVCPHDARLLPRPLYLCHLQCVKGLLLCQQPFPRQDQATGLVLEVPVGCFEPKSLTVVRNVLKTEAGASAKHIKRIHPSTWARQGILMLNVNLMSIQGLREGGGGDSDDGDISWKSFVKYLIGLVIERYGNKVPTLAIGSDAQAIADGMIHPEYIVRTHHAVNRNSTGMNFSSMAFTMFNMLIDRAWRRVKKEKKQDGGVMDLDESAEGGGEEEEEEEDDDRPAEIDWFCNKKQWLEEDLAVLSDYFEISHQH